MSDLRRRTVFGLGWSAAAQSLGRALQFATTVVLARLLSPREFGLVGMILVITGFASSLADIGLGASVIQRQTLSERHLDSVFWLIVAIGGALTICCILAAPAIASFYGEPQLRPLTVAVAFNFFLGSLGVVQNSLLQKSLNFRIRFWVEVVAISISGIVALVLALTGAGVWSLVGQSLSETAARTALLWRGALWSPGRSFDLASIRELLKFARPLIGSNIMNYWAQNFDKMVIGRQIGSSALGVYNLADRLMRLPLTNVTAVTGSVMFPAFSTLQGDVESVRRVYLKANRMVSLLTFPMMLGLSALAEPAIEVVYGAKWRNAIVIVQLLCFAGLAQSVYNTAGWIFLSLGRSDILFRLGTLSALVRVAGVLIGIHWGLLGVAGAYVVGGYAFLLYPTWSAAGGLIGLSFIELMKNIAGPFYCAVGMAAVVGISNRWMLSEHTSWLWLAVLVTGGAIVYGFLIRYFRLQAWEDVRELILETGGKRNRLIQWFVGNRPRLRSQ